MKELTKRLRLFLYDQNITLAAIQARRINNPFPIGRISLYRIANGKEVSENIRVKLTDYLNDFKDEKL